MSDILSQFKALKLHGMAECYAVLRAQGQAGTSSEDIGSTAWVLRQLLAAETTDRSIRAIRYQMTSAKFPTHPDLLGFDFDQAKVDQQLVNKLVSGAGESGWQTRAIAA